MEEPAGRCLQARRTAGGAAQRLVDAGGSGNAICVRFRLSGEQIGWVCRCIAMFLRVAPVSDQLLGF